MLQVHSRIALKYSFAVFLFVSLLWACSSKKLSNKYGDNKEYRDEDSAGTVKVIEKKAKMPFDTAVVVPLYNNK